MNIKTDQPQCGTSFVQSSASFDDVQNICSKLFGFKLFTVLKNLPETGEIQRIYSSNPTDYPPGGRKPMGPTPWGKVVLEDGLSWLGNGRQDIIWAFPDAELIFSLGCESCACAPIIKNGITIAVLSLSDVVDHYDHEDLKIMSYLASLLVNAVEETL